MTAISIEHGRTLKNVDSRGIAAKTLRIVTMTIAALYFVTPLYWLLVASSKSRAELSTTPALLFSDGHLWENLGNLFSQGNGIYLRWMFNSFSYSLVGALFGTFAAALAGYCLAMFRFKGSNLLFMVVLGAVMVPATALSLPLFLMFAGVGLTNTVWSVVLPVLVSPLALYLCKLSAEASVPLEIIEAGRLDGAGEFRIFFSISARLMGPSMVTVFLLQFVGIWNNYMLPLLMLQDNRLFSVTLGLNTWNSQVAQQPELQTLVLAGSLVSIIPLVIVFFSMQRYLRAGVAAGGVKA